MPVKVKTTKIKANVDYAKVADRLNEFRSKYPRSKIAVKYSLNEDGDLTHRAYIWKDKTDYMEILKAGISEKTALESADAEASALMYANRVKSEKGFEKNETIAIGRALAILGYATSGEVATTEEMEEFEDFRRAKAEEAIETAETNIASAKDIEELLKVWQDLDRELQLNDEVRNLKDKRKGELSESPRTTAK